MDRVNPIDLERVQLRRAFRGYDRRATEHVLANAAAQIEVLLTENKRLKDSLAEAEREVKRFRQTESTMTEALVLAQRAADDTKAAAHREAEVIRAAAEQRASETRAKALESLQELRWEIDRLKQERSVFAHRFRALLSEHLAVLDRIEAAEAAPDSAVVEPGSEAPVSPEAATG